MKLSRIEPLGIGLAADVAGQKPNYRLLMEGSKDERIDYLNVAATHLQLPRLQKYVDDLVQAGFPMVFHPVTYNLVGTGSDQLEISDGNGDIANYLGARWAGQDLGIWNWSGQYLAQYMIPAILDPASAREAAGRVGQISNGLSCLFAVENPPVTYVVETMHMLDYVGMVSTEADCGIVLDVGHLIAYQHATRRALSDMPMGRFPFNRVVEIHLAGLYRSTCGGETTYLDRHDLPVPEESWTFLTETLPKMVNLKGITMEAEFSNEADVRTSLKRARDLVLQHGKNSGLAEYLA